MTRAPKTNASFSVEDAAGVVLATAPIGASSGTWGDFTVYPLDFRIRGSGLYRLVVSGSIAADSPIFPVAAAARLYPEALANALYFFQNERGGANFIRTPLRRAPGHLHDEQAAVYLTP